jgi:hypothetical protein
MLASSKVDRAFVQIELDDVDALAHAGQHIGIVDLDAVAAAAALRLQIGQQRAVAATQVKHAGTHRHQTGDRLHRQQVAHGAAPAEARPAAIWSK